MSVFTAKKKANVINSIELMTRTPSWVNLSSKIDVIAYLSYPQFLRNPQFPSLISCFILAYTSEMESGRFPNKLKSYRRSCGYSQKKVARILSLSDTSTLSRWEHGVATPSIIHAFRLARIYHTLPHDLYDELWHKADTECSLLAQDEEPFITNQSFYV